MFCLEAGEISFTYFSHILFGTWGHFSKFLRLGHGAPCPAKPGSFRETENETEKAMFGDQQMSTLADIIQSALMLRYNKRPVG